MWGLRRVQGTSMAPTLLPGAIVLVGPKPAKLGDVVVAQMQGREVVKRIKRITKDRYYLVGDNSLESTDSRELGPVRPQAVKGVVIGRLPQAKFPIASTRLTRVVELVLAAVILAMAVAQLVRFDKFIPVLSDTYDAPWDLFLGSSAVILEVFALPVLLGMALSSLARAVGRSCGWLVGLLWIAIGLNSLHAPSGLLGGFVVVSGVGAALVGSLLTGGMSYVLWLKHKRHTS